jgi:exopolyphosphatase/guanosine-5'-triphosphate,3'-diphosphate pyrophosphatase
MTNKPTIEILIKNCYKDIQHVKQVSKYSEMLFDTLNNKMFSYTEKEKKYLKVAALLHDIGYCIEKKSHHKHSMNMILENGLRYLK